MATYLIQFSFTQKGLEQIKESPARVAAAKETIRTMGGEVRVFYAILGSRYDTMFIVDAPDDKKVAEMALAIAMGGNVQTRTHRLFKEDEFKAIISSLP